MVGQPWMLGQGQPTAEQQAAIGWQWRHGLEEGVSCRSQALVGSRGSHARTVEPVALTLEGIGRQGRESVGLLAHHGPPVHLVTLHMQRSESALQVSPPAAIAAQRADDDAAGIRTGRGQGHGEHRMSADLDEHSVTFRPEVL